MKKETNQLTSSCRVGIQDINALLSAPISRIKTLRDDEGRNGFTLIELLVVVLIIGILAAITLPQYNKAILKSKLIKVIGVMHTIAVAQEAYFLTNGHYTNNFSLLDIQFPLKTGNIIIDNTWTCHMSGFGTTNSSPRLQCVSNNANDPWLENYLGSTQGFCWANSSLKKKLCASLPGAFLEGGYYKFQL